jgi:hypothetical protein
MEEVYPVWVVSGRKQELYLSGAFARFPPAIRGDFSLARVVVIARFWQGRSVF